MLDGIKNYLSMESTGALMVSGEWGCGKTYHIENVIIPALQQEGWNPVKVSLFGIESVNEIPFRIADNYKWPATNEDGRTENKMKSLLKFGKNKTSRLVAQSARLVSSISWLGNFVDIKTLVENNSSLLYKLIPQENTVIFLDDVERVIDIIDVQTLLGAINGLVEQRGYKVVIIANNSYMQQKGEAKLVFKEKVIEKTLIYEPDVVAIFKEICKKIYSGTPFAEFMTTPKSVEVIDPVFPSYKEHEDLCVELRNIRILKFALSHFNKIYVACEDFLRNENRDLADSFLLSLWACTVGLAIEYKKDRLNYKDRTQFSQYVELSTIDWDFDDGSQKGERLFDKAREGNTEEKQKEESQRANTYHSISFIYEKLVKVHNFPVIVSPQVFDFVTANISPDVEGLKTVWEGYKSLVQRNSKSPAYVLLQKLMHSPWNMSNEEMVEAVMQLAQYVEEGLFSDNMSYVNAATYLQHFGSLTSFSQEDIHSKIVCGINKMYEKVDTLNILDKLNLDVVETDIPKESRWVVDYERKKMEEVMANNLATDIKEARKQFNENLSALANRLTIQPGDDKTPDFLSYPILSRIPQTDIVQKVDEIQPKEVIALYHILNGRFLQYVADPKVYEEELQFVRNLEQALTRRKTHKKVYADILIEDYLMRVIKKIQK